MTTNCLTRLLTLFAVSLLCISNAYAEDGYDLWLRYRPLNAGIKAVYAKQVARIVDTAADAPTPTRIATINELKLGLGGLLGTAISSSSQPSNGAVLLVNSSSTALLKQLALPLASLGKEGYLLKRAAVQGKSVIVIAAQTDQGLLYGAFHLLRLIQTQQKLDQLDVTSVPKLQLRVLNHWDNLTGTVERGFAGGSIFNWWRLPDLKDPRLVDYARANASIGINGAVINNVNSKTASLSAPYIAKAAAIADAIRPYGIKVYITANFNGPMDLGKLKTNDPLDPSVKAWWQAKADEIYKAIPDFGGFLVKANSEGLPGPGDYGRTHADGANMLAEALKPHGGIVMWRAFVYDDNPDDRAKQAYTQFLPLDGKFADNVLVQVKNGPIDFQPREPFHPLYGAMPKTPLMMEFEITKEYLGQATHLVYLGKLWEEVLEADTYRPTKGATVANVIEGKVTPQALTGMAGVANIGTDRNWSGSDFDQANWYAYGRLAWDPQASSSAIAQEWLKMTFSNDPAFVEPALAMMIASREAVVDYMTPLGLHHIKANIHHHGPGPWVDSRSRKDQNSTYFHQADSNGIGFDRTATGSNALGQYAQPMIEAYADPHKMDERYLLWFHHLPWDYEMQSGNTLWNELVADWSKGVKEVQTMQKTWASLQRYVDPQRFEAVVNNLRVQEREATWWRDACIAYFQSINKLPLPKGEAPPAKSLEQYKAEEADPFAPGTTR